MNSKLIGSLFIVGAFASTSLVEADVSDGLVAAAGRGDEYRVQQFLWGGADPNTADSSGRKAVIWASVYGHAGVVEILLGTGADLNVFDSRYGTALTVASQNSHTDVVEVLLKAGADVDIAKSDGWTALILASGNGNAKVVEMLLDEGADVNASTKIGETALMIASQNGHVETVEILLEAGSHVNASAKNGARALLLASLNGHAEVIEVLLKAGAEVNAARTDGATALMAASHNGHTEAVRALLKAGADVKAANAGGLTALRIAQNNQHHEIVEILLKSIADLDAASSSVQSGPIERMKTVQPIVPSLEQMSRVPSFSLGQGYQVVESTVSQLEMAIENPRIVLMLNIDGQMVKITQENGPGILKAFRERLEVYREAIEQRGHVEIEGWYAAQINESIEGEEYFDLVELFADAELSHHKYLLAREIQIKQEDFEVELAHTMTFRGEERDTSMPGLAIGESIVFEVPNIGVRFYGVFHDDTIEIRVDLNELERTLSFEYAMDSLDDPGKAAASGLHKKKPSEWIVRLKRNPSNKPTDPSPSDQLLVLTPDKKLLKVTRAEVQLD